MRNWYLFFLWGLSLFPAPALSTNLDSLNVLAQTQTGPRRAATLNELAKAHFSIDPRKAFALASEALTLARQGRDIRQMATALSYGGSAQYLLGDYKTALRLYLQALPLFEKTADAKGISSVTNNLGNVQYDLGNLDQATHFYQRSLAMDERLGDRGGVAGSYHNLANIASDQHAPQRALDYNFRALRLYEQLRDLRNVGISYNNLGREYQTLGQTGKARLFLNKALKISQQLGDNEAAGYALYNLSKAPEAEGKYGEALQLLRRAEAIAEGAAYTELRRETLGKLADLSAKNGEYRRAFVYQKSFEVLNDSLFKQENTRYIADLQTKYETEKKEQRIRLLAQDNAIQTLQLDRNRTVLFSALGGLLLALGLAGVLHNRSQFRRRANLELERANALIRRSVAEKETLIQEIHHRVKNNLQLVTSLLNWQTEGVTDEKTLRIIDEGRARVRSMALIHEHLYKSENLAEVNLQAYLGELVDTLDRSYRQHAGVVVEKRIEPFHFDADVVVPLGLIASELVSNAFKYAFPGGASGQVWVDLTRVAEGYRFSVGDTGVGLPADFGSIRRDSLGLQLVETLTKQLKGKLHIGQEGGTCFEITFPGKGG